MRAYGKRKKSLSSRMVKGAAAYAGAAAGAATATIAFGVMDYLYDPEFFRSGRKPSPSMDRAPGEAEVSPPLMRAGKGRNTVTIRFRCGPGGISEEGGVKVGLCRLVDYGARGVRPTFTMAHGWGSLQNRYPRLGNYYSCELHTAGDARLESASQGFFPLRAAVRLLGREFLRRSGAKLDKLDVAYLFLEQAKIRLKVKDDRLREGDEIVITLGDTGGGGRGWHAPALPSRAELAVEVDERALGDYRLIRDIPVLEVVGGEAVEFQAVLPSLRCEEEGRMLLEAVDEKGCPDPAFHGEVELSSTPGLEIPSRAQFAVEDSGVLSLPVKVLEHGVQKVEASGEGISGGSNPMLAVREGPRLFWGDIHVHTVLCDGAMEPGEFYRHARDVQGLDFAAITTHDTMERIEPSGREEEWELAIELRDMFNQSGGFAVFLGYEWSDHKQGHRGVFFAPDDEDSRIYGFLDPRSDTQDKLRKVLGEHEAIVIPHHTAWRRIFFVPWNWAKFLNMKIPQPYQWWEPGDEQQRLVEIYSDHGSSELYDSAFPITHGKPDSWFPRFLSDDRCDPGIGNYVQEALAGGLRLGIIAGSDRHDYAVDARVYPVSIYPGGLTAIWAEELSDESLWRSLWNRRVYATTGARIIVEFFADGLPMGTEYFSAEGPMLHGRVIGTAPLRHAELLRHDGRGYTTAWSCRGGVEAEFDFVDDDLRGEGFYYLRVEQEDGHYAWSSPIWVMR
ncbi:MAG: DUF3604 domain-containing protein [Actinomycetota bacterium]|nr:DUF3604 domain-containing protein [Actinomycetota bacterium]